MRQLAEAWTLAREPRLAGGPLPRTAFSAPERAEHHLAVAAPELLLVLFDDLHAADPSSLALLEFVARELRDCRVAIVATLRDQERGASSAPLPRGGRPGMRWSSRGGTRRNCQSPARSSRPGGSGRGVRWRPTRRPARAIAFDLANGGDGTHQLSRETDPTVAFVEAFDHFATRFAFFLRQNPAATISAATRKAFIQDQFAREIAATLNGPLETGSVSPNSALRGSSVEGAIYGALFLDFARRDGIGLSRTVEIYCTSGALTFGQLRTWIKGHQPTLEAPLDAVAATWRL